MSEFFTPQNGEELSDGRPALVLDTNTVLALWMFRDPALMTLREWIEAGKCRLFSREDALEELRRVLAYRQFGLDAAMQCALLHAYRARVSILAAGAPAAHTAHHAPLPACRDSDDQKFLEIARSAGAATLMTRDKALLRLARHRLIRTHFAIQSPEAFLAQTLRLASAAAQ